MTSPYDIVRVPDFAYREDEQLGTKKKFWFYGLGEGPVLFKKGRANEDWSEKVAAEVALQLGLPAASVDLAEHEGEAGIVSPSFLARGDQLFHGNELLLGVRPDYPQHDRYHVRQHTLGTVFEALEFVGAEADPDRPWPWNDFGAPDQFVGYVMLDALIGNTDRHHENWAVVQRGNLRFLAPTYDHASSLGRNEPEHKMRARVEGRDPRVTVEAYVQRGKSAFYAENGANRPLRTIDAFARAAELRPRAARYWIDRLIEGTEEAFTSLLDAVPSERISDLHREFAARMLSCNRARLVAVRDAFDGH